RAEHRPRRRGRRTGAGGSRRPRQYRCSAARMLSRRRGDLQRGGGALFPSLPAGTAMNVEFVYNYFCGALTCTQWVDGSLFALTYDPNLANNFASITLPFTTGSEALLVAPQPLLY